MGPRGLGLQFRRNGTNWPILLALGQRVSSGASVVQRKQRIIRRYVGTCVTVRNGSGMVVIFLINKYFDWLLDFCKQSLRCKQLHRHYFLIQSSSISTSSRIIEVCKLYFRLKLHIFFSGLRSACHDCRYQSGSSQLLSHSGRTHNSFHQTFKTEKREP